MVRGKYFISPGLLIYAAVVLLVLPLKWIAAWTLAVTAHEMGHIVMMKLLGVRINYMDAGVNGASLHMGAVSVWKEFLCALAGPTAGFALLLAAPVFPRLALCAGLQSCYNLLPVYPLDGGRMVWCAAQWIMPHNGYKLCKVIERLCLGGILLLGIYGCFLKRLGLMPLVIAWFTVIRALGRKIPCKEGRLALQ